MKHLILVFMSGLIFALGLGISGMTDANKVIAFLNVAGQWDPSLAFVMVGAIGVHLVLYKLILKRESPIYEKSFKIPSVKGVDGKLLGGTAIFGVGWGLGGFCPGPGVVSSVNLNAEPVSFTLAMVAGMLLFDAIIRLYNRSAP